MACQALFEGNMKKNPGNAGVDKVQNCLEKLAELFFLGGPGKRSNR